MHVFEEEVVVPATTNRESLLEQLRESCSTALPEGIHPVRFVVASTTSSRYQCELGVVGGLAPVSHLEIASGPRPMNPCTFLRNSAVFTHGTGSVEWESLNCKQLSPG